MFPEAALTIVPVFAKLWEMFFPRLCFSRVRYACLWCAVAALSGVAVFYSFAPHGVWPGGILGYGLLLVSIHSWGYCIYNRNNAMKKTLRKTLGAGVILGVIHGCVAYGLLLPWVGTYVGNLPYIALVIANAIYMGIFGLGAALLFATGYIGKRHHYWIHPAIVLWYVAVEWAHSHFPFGGFSWVRLAWGQIEGPLRFLAAVGGPALVTCCVVAVGHACACLCIRQWRSALSLGVVGVVLACGGWLYVHAESSHDAGEITAAAVQGNVPRLGLDFNEQRQAVLRNHVSETITLAHDAQDSHTHIDAVVWPENASDVNPFADATAYDLIMEAVNAVNAPVLVGAVTRDDVGERNTIAEFAPSIGVVAGEYHYKKFLQPFGEYMPLRSFFRIFSSYVDRAGDFKPGDGNGIVHAGEIPFGIATCYEVAFDEAYRSSVRAGAQILAAPTNNATFGFTTMTYQQLAMTRLRAIEMNRAVVVAATSGVSAMVDRDGSVLSETGIFEAGYLIASLPLRTDITFAARWGGLVETAMTIMGIAAVCMAAYVLVRRLCAARRSGSFR